MMIRMKITSSFGIYQICSMINGKKYIGSACNLKTRIFNEHFRDLKKGTHYNPHLQNHVNKYGIDDLWFGILEFCSKESLKEREQYWINTLKPEFNIAKDAKNPMLGRHHTEESKIKTSDHHLKYYRTEEGKRSSEKGRKSKLAFYQTEEGILLRQKIGAITGGENSPMKTAKNRRINSEGHKKYYQTEEGKKTVEAHREHMKEFYQTERGKELRRKYSENHPTKRLEVRQKMSDSQKIYFNTEEGKIRKQKNIELLRSPEVRQKQLLAVRTPESLQRRSQAAKVGWKKRNKAA